MTGLRSARAALLLLLAWSLTACVATGQRFGRVPATDRGDTGRIVVASFDFAESVLLAELYAMALEAEGLPVSRVPNLGSREIVQPAILQDRVDVVPEYAGTALGFLTFGGVPLTSSPATLRRRLAWELRRHDIMVLDMAPAQNKNGVVVTAETADRLGLRAISDLKGMARRLSFGGPPECPERPLCLPGLEQRYGLGFRRFVPLDPGGPTTVAALEEGQIDVGLLFTTDPSLAAGDLVLLRDDRGLQPAENVVPIVRLSVIERFGTRVREALDAVSARLTTRVLRRLNHRVAVTEEPRAVALEWLESEGLVR